MSESGYKSDLEELVKNTINPKKKKRKLRKKKNNKSTLKNSKLATKFKTQKHISNPNVLPEYKDSIYYNTKIFDTITKHILDSNLLTSYKDTSQIESELNKTIETGKQNSSKQVSITINKSVINGKEHEEVKITENNSDKEYIKEYTYVNGKTKLKNIKRDKK
jgi:hypothetical protein